MFSIQKIHYPDHAWHIIGHFWSNQGVQLQAFELKLGKSFQGLNKGKIGFKITRTHPLRFPIQNDYYIQAFSEYTWSYSGQSVGAITFLSYNLEKAKVNTLKLG